MGKCPICKREFQRSFSVPQDDKQRERWSEICGVELSRTARVCTDHFSENSIIYMGKRIQLMPFAEPVNHLPSIDSQELQNCIERVQELPDSDAELYNSDSVITADVEECYEDSQILNEQFLENGDQIYEFKCGEIFWCNFKDLRISCDFCKSKQFSLEDFLIHINNVHLQKNDFETQSLDDIKSKNFEMQIERNKDQVEGEDGWLESFEEVHTLVENDDTNYISEDNDNDDETVKDDYNKEEIDDVSTQPEEHKEKENNVMENEEEVIMEDRCNMIVEDEGVSDDEKENKEENLLSQKKATFNFEEDLNSLDNDIESIIDNYDVDEFIDNPLKDNDDVKDKTVKKKRQIKKVVLEFQCPECPQQFTLKKILDNHVFENHGGYKCSTCNKRFRMRQHLVQHEERHNNTQYSCTVPGCNKVFADLEYCKRHIENHSSDLKYKCPYENCGKGFLTLMRLKLHKKLHTKGQVNRKKLNYVCDICGYSCHASTTLQIHQRLHTGEKPFKCEICGNHYISQYALKKHMVSHSNERKFKCDHCEATFKSNEVLSRHKYLHSEERQFKCSYCGKAFKQSHCRDAHIKHVHRGIKHVRAKRKRKQKIETPKIVIEVLNMDS